MTTKFKILTSITFIALAIVLTFVGVWAIADLDFAVGGDITYIAPEPQEPIITMGEYQGEKVEWKLIAVDGNKFNGTTMPSSGIGTFIISTGSCQYITEYFHDEMEMVEYENATIRDYLKNEYIATLNLSNDATYNKIQARTIKDMCKGSGYDMDTGEVYDKTSTSTESDKLWLLSVKEMYEWVGGGVVGSDNIISETDWNTYAENYKWKSNPDNPNGDLDYWLRSSYILSTGNYKYPYETCTTIAYTDGSLHVEFGADSPHPPRPAFNIDLSLL